MLKLNENFLIDRLLFGNPKYSFSINSEILMTSISYILLTKRFNESLVWKLHDITCFPFLFKLGSWWSFGNMNFDYIFFSQVISLWLTDPLHQRFVFSFHCILLFLPSFYLLLLYFKLLSCTFIFLGTSNATGDCNFFILNLLLCIKWYKHKYIIWEVNSKNGGSIWKTTSPHYASKIGDFMQSQSSFLISLLVNCTLIPWLLGSFRFP